jgi:hypothetical protein
MRGPKMVLKCVVGRMGGLKASEPEAILSCIVGRLCGPNVCVCVCVRTYVRTWWDRVILSFVVGRYYGPKIILEFARLD